MSRRLPRALAVILLALLAPGAFAHAQSTPADTIRHGQVRISDPYLASLVERMSNASPTFRAAMDSLANGAVPVRIAPAADLVEDLGLDSSVAFAHLKPQVREDGKISFLISVGVDVKTMRSVYGLYGEEDAVDNDVAIMLAHELYGHALSFVRNLPDIQPCLDPQPFILNIARMVGPDLYHVLKGAGADIQGCAVRRENEVRAELSLPLRPHYLDTSLTFRGNFDLVMFHYRKPDLSAAPRPVVVPAVRTEPIAPAIP